MNSRELSVLLLGSAHPPSYRKRAARWLRYGPKLILETLRDAGHYIRHAGTFDFSPQQRFDAKITQAYHNIEKGLSLPKPRLGFGARAIRILLDYINGYRELYGASSVILSARDVLSAYVDYHVQAGFFDYPYKSEIEATLESLKGYKCSNVGGVRQISRAEIQQAIGGCTEEFFLSRHSIRDFSEADVDPEDIDAAIRVAQKAPVVCNRQSGAVHVIANKELIAATLELQGGARGFAQKVNKVIVVTTDTRNFSHAEERNQGWIDGGLFAMSLIYGLHLRGLGTCCLNWSKTHKQSDLMRSLVGLKPWEAIIMLVAVGHLPDRLVVPFSVRKDMLLISRTITHWHRPETSTANKKI